MRVLRAAAVLAFAVSALPGAAADAATPHPSTCTASVQAAMVPANPGGLVTTAAVVVMSGQVECHRDPLRTAPIDLVAPYGGHIDIDVRTDTGTFVCDEPHREYDSVGPLLVMEIEDYCVIDVTNPNRLRPLQVRLRWATLPPYVCCGERTAWVSPVGIG